jgi:hypothetical protein
MEVWILVVITYLAVGLFSVLIGPAARQRRIETEKLEWQSFDQPRWKLKAFAAAIALGIILLWPILVISAKRKESSPINDFADLEEIPASAELSSRISEIRQLYPTSLPFEVYQSVLEKLPWSDETHFDKQLEELGYVVVGFAKSSDGQEIAVATSVLKIGMSIELTGLRGTAASAGISFRTAQKPDDEVWDFSSSRDSWQHLAGRAGLALVRDGTVIETSVTVMN